MKIVKAIATMVLLGTVIWVVSGQSGPMPWRVGDAKKCIAVMRNGWWDAMECDSGLRCWETTVGSECVVDGWEISFDGK